jgi:hypothetical protein
MAQVLQHLPSKHEALSSKSSITKTKQTNKKTGRKFWDHFKLIKEVY